MILSLSEVDSAEAVTIEESAAEEFADRSGVAVELESAAWQPVSATISIATDIFCLVIVSSGKLRILPSVRLSRALSY